MTRHHKKRKAYHCVYHPVKIAKFRCSGCGQWICKQCATEIEGQFYCTKVCLPKLAPSILRQEEILIKDESFSHAIDREKKSSWKLRLGVIVLCAGITFGSGGIVFGLILLKRSQELEIILNAYKKNRIELINLIKQKNRQIHGLQDSIENLFISEKKSASVDLAQKEKISFHSFPSKHYFYSPGEIPLTFDNGISTQKMISLTFDGHYLSNVAGEILDTLKSREVTATMFLTAMFIQRNASLVRRMIAENHEIGNHTASHPHLTSYEKTRTQSLLPSITAEFVGQELRNANDEFKKVAGMDMLPLWRAPYGEKNDQLCRWALEYGFLHIGWRQARTWKYNFDTYDWVPDPQTPGYHTPDQILKKFSTLSTKKPYGINGAIILMHLGTLRKNRNHQMHRYLGTLIDTLRANGYTFVPVTGLLKEAGIDISLIQSKEKD